MNYVPLAALGFLLASCGGSSLGGNGARGANTDAKAATSDSPGAGSGGTGVGAGGSGGHGSGGAGGTTTEPMCYVDSPCYVMNKRYRCSNDGRHYQRYEEVSCSSVCGSRPCSGGGCRLDGIEQECPSGRACRPLQDISADQPCQETVDASVAVVDAGFDARISATIDGRLDVARDGQRDGQTGDEVAARPDTGPDLPAFVVDGGLASFCSGPSPRTIVNGIESYPTVTAKQLCYSCCIAGTFAITTETFSVPIFVSWTLPGGPVREGEIWTRDLAKLTGEYPLRITAGCDPTYQAMLCRGSGEGCASVGEIHETGFTGVLQLVGIDNVTIDGSICLRFKEPGRDAGAALQSLDLYVPHAQLAY